MHIYANGNQNRVLYSILNEILRMIKENVYHTKYNFAYQLIVLNYKHV